MLNLKFTPNVDHVVNDSSRKQGSEGAVCANDGTATEAYCSYDVGPKACARCTNPIAALSSSGDSLARVRWSTMQLLALMGVASIAFSAMN